jgi:Protein of unknown function (DUF3500).
MHRSRPAPRVAAAAAVLAVAGAAGVLLTVPRPRGTAAARFLSPAEAATLVPTAAAEPPHALAMAFLDSLDPAQRERARLAFDDDNRLDWHFVPMTRKGIPLKDLSPAQQKAGMALLASCLSEQGYRKAEAVRALETVLQEIENDPEGRVRNPGLYYFTVYGTPGAKGIWGWRYEGHHLSFNFTLKDGRVIASSPQFLGANPASVASRGGAAAAGQTQRALAAEEDLGRALATSLTPAQRQKGIRAGAVPGDILTGAQRKVEPLEAGGIPYRELNATQKGLLLELIRTHAAVQSKPVAEARLAAIRKAGLDDVTFLWIGGLETGERHYYRIQGKTFLVEYDNTQNRANHIHVVWRDFAGDFGRDVLADHYRAFPANTVAGKAHGHSHGHEHDHGSAPKHDHGHAHAEAR